MTDRPSEVSIIAPVMSDYGSAVRSNCCVPNLDKDERLIKAAPMTLLRPHVIH